MKELQKEKWIGIALGIVGIAASIFIRCNKDENKLT